MTNPNFAHIGTSTSPAALVVGVYENAIHVIKTLKNADESNPLLYAKGRVFALAPDGSVAPVATANFAPVEATVLIPGEEKTVVDETLGAADNAKTVFSFAHAPITALDKLSVGDVEVTTGFTVDKHRGTVTFGTAPASGDVEATYKYREEPDEQDIFVPPLFGYVPMILEEDVTIPERAGGVDGAVDALFVIKGEVAQDLLLIGTTKFGSLTAAQQAALYNILTTAGLIPVYVKR